MKRYITRPAKSSKRFKVGSQYFFSQYPDYVGNDSDYVEFEEDPKLYRNVMQLRKADKSLCLFKWRKMSADEFVAYTLRTNLPMEIGKFLVPEVAEFLGFTIEHLKQLNSVADRLDEKHRYEKVIYDAYLTNGSFTLTDEQRNAAYQEYVRTR